MAIRAADYVVVCAGEHETLTCIAVGEVFLLWPLLFCCRHCCSAVAIVFLWDGIGWCVGAKLRLHKQ